MSIPAYQTDLKTDENFEEMILREEHPTIQRRRIRQLSELHVRLLIDEELLRMEQADFEERGSRNLIYSIIAIEEHRTGLAILLNRIPERLLPSVTEGRETGVFTKPLCDVLAELLEKL
jgi:hypothetical protein